LFSFHGWFATNDAFNTKFYNKLAWVTALPFDAKSFTNHLTINNSCEDFARTTLNRRHRRNAYFVYRVPSPLRAKWRWVKFVVRICLIGVWTSAK
jgi:hypothetical protein